MPLLGVENYPAWEAIGPWGGAARVIRLDADRPSTLMAISMRGTGVFRSRDAAQSWTHLTAFPEIPNARLDCGLIVPGQWLVGAAPGGLWRSTDEGETWKVIPGTEKLSVYAISVWPKDSRILAAGTNQGVWMSNDGAKTWRRISPASVADLAAIVSVAFDPLKAGTIYAGTPHLPWKTTDGGQTWRKVHVGMFDDSDIFSIAVDPLRPDRVFASACSGIYCSLNGGTAWRRVQGIPGTNRRTYVVMQSPHNREILFAGTSAGMWVSRDAGMVWSKLNSYVATSIAWNPADRNLLYISTERHGLLRSQNEGTSFEPVNEGFVSRSILAVDSDEERLFAVAPYEGLYARKPDEKNWSMITRGRHFDRFAVADGRLLARDPDRGWQASTDGGQTWAGVSQQAAEQPRGDWYETAVDPFDSSVMLRASHAGLAKSTDGGKTWRMVQTEWIRSVAFHPKRKGLCFALRHHRVFWSSDGGDNWYWMPAREEPHLVFERLYVTSAMPDKLLAVSPHRGLYVQKIPELR